MKKLPLKIAIGTVSILTAIAGFEIINIESLYEDQEFVGAPTAYLKSLKGSVYLMEFLSGAFIVTLLILIILYNKKGEANNASPKS